jgi:hypothetical protein
VRPPRMGDRGTGCNPGNFRTFIYQCRSEPVVEHCLPGTRILRQGTSDVLPRHGTPPRRIPARIGKQRRAADRAGRPPGAGTAIHSEDNTESVRPSAGSVRSTTGSADRSVNGSDDGRIPEVLRETTSNPRGNGGWAARQSVATDYQTGAELPFLHAEGQARPKEESDTMLTFCGACGGWRTGGRRQ